MKKRRFVSMLTAAALALTGYWPGSVLTASAEPYSGAEVQQGSADIASSDNTFGAMLAADINQENARIMSGCAVHGVELNEKTAAVSFDATQSGRVVVCVYTDPTGRDNAPQLLGTGMANFTADDKTAEVTVQITSLPQYYLVRVYMIGANDVPLSTEYTDATHTLEMQQLMESDISDYEGYQILNMDDSTETNFAVYEKDVQVLQQSSTENIVTLQDNENCIYKIQNYTGPTRTGTVVSVEGGNGTAAIFKIGSVKTEGDVTVIQGDRAMEPEDAFAYIKVETDSTDSAASYTPPELPEEYAHIPVTGEVAEEQKPAQGRPGIAGAEDAEEPDISHRSGQKLFRIQLGKGFDQDGTLLPNTGVGVEINGILELNFGYDVTIYRTRQFDRIVFGCTSSFDFGVEFAATAEIKIPLGSALIFDHCADVHFTLGPYFIASITGIVRFTGSIGSSFGTETGADARCSCGDCSLSAEGFIGFGIGFEGYLLDRGAELSLEAGFKVALAPNDPHKGCGICYALTLSLELRFTAVVELGIFDLGIAPTLDIDFGHAYISDALGFGFGVCPNLTNPPEDPLADPGEWTPAESEDGLTDLQRYYYTFVELEDGYGVKRKEESKILETALPEIPTYYNGKPVVEILPYAFSSICRITSVTLPRKLKRIGKRAFSSNPNYNFVSGYYGSAIWFPDTLESIGEGAFSGSRLTSIHFPASLTSIGDYAFVGNSCLTLVLPNTLQHIGKYAFSGSKLKTVIFEDGAPDGITVIPAYAFNECRELQSVRFPNTLRVIEEYAFYECGEFPIMLPNGVHSIGDKAFCCPDETMLERLKPRRFGTYDLVIPATLSSAGEAVFGNRVMIDRLIFPYNFGSALNAPSLYGTYPIRAKSADLPFNWTVIPAHFFENCSISRINLPPKLREIGDYALCCRELKQISLPKTLRKIGKGAFSGCFELEGIDIPEGVTEIAESTFEDCNSFEKVTIPNTVKTIGNKAFSECPKLSSITLPRSLETLYFRAFDNYTRDSAYVITRELTVNGSTKTTFSYSSPRTITFLNPNTQFLDDPETLKSDYIPEGGYKPTIEYGNFLTLCGYPSSTAQAFAENPDHICRFIGLTSSSATVSEPTGEPQTMTFTGLLPNTVYNFYDLLGSSFTSGNLLYLSQGISDENGTLTVWYRPRMTDTNGTKYVRCNDSSLTETPAVTTTTEPATPVTTTTKPLTPVTTTTTKPMTPVQTTTPKAATTPKVTTAATTSRPISTVQGDANGDFVVDVSDAVLIARFCAEDSSADISRQGILNADVNRSGSPDPDDTIQILRFIAKLIKSF